MIYIGNNGEDFYVGTATEVFGKGGGDILRSTSASDVMMNGGRGGDRLITGDGDDILKGGKGKDSLRGMAGDDTLLGGRGSDIMNGGTGADIMAGGRGKDTFRFDFSEIDAVDTITDFKPGKDKVQIRDDTLSPHDNEDATYSFKDGTVWYDVDGDGGADAIAVVHLVGVSSLTDADISI